MFGETEFFRGLMHRERERERDRARAREME